MSENIRHFLLLCLSKVPLNSIQPFILNYLFYLPIIIIKNGWCCHLGNSWTISLRHFTFTFRCTLSADCFRCILHHQTFHMRRRHSYFIFIYVHLIIFLFFFTFTGFLHEGRHLLQRHCYYSVSSRLSKFWWYWQIFLNIICLLARKVNQVSCLQLRKPG